jgi:hypothetical protein
MSDLDDYQNDANTPLPGDDDLMRLPRRQLQKAEAILNAYLAGDEMWVKALPDVAALLRAGHMHDLVTTCQIRGVPSVAEASAALDSWPWPRQQSGPPNT